ncbi:hypothetical protein [Phytohabitans kaempferiae]|uniref:NB-ARC domain-containing protein n=1 Tax=Phytohabitans kaempferiae TaxID=1620943 RepID=A0ABV6M7S9_9ACTN
MISAIEGMAGVGKTQLAIHAGHLLIREHHFGRALFVNLRGFPPTPLGLPRTRLPSWTASCACSAYRPSGSLTISTPGPRPTVTGSPAPAP